MNKQDFIKVMIPVSEYYSKALTDGMIEVYYMQVKDWDLCLFESMLNNHIQDASNGRYWPTVAHLISQSGTSESISVKAGIAFDDNPLIDGFSSYNAGSETMFDRSARRKIFCSKQKLIFNETPTIEILNNFYENKLINLAEIKATKKITSSRPFPAIEG